MVEFSRYYGMPWVRDVATDVDAALDLLRSVIAEMERRQEVFMEAGGARFFDAYQSWARRNGKDPLPRIVVLVDEIADVVLSGGGQVRDDLARLASKGRAFGVHLILATQRPDREVIRGLTKVNLPTRIAFRVPAHVDSQLILGRPGAERLPSTPGRYLLAHGSRTGVVQAYHVPDSLFDTLKDRAAADFFQYPRIGST
jgi:S-DNA-T family DNA segregation ATPase FtsK/SpoIIIE